MIDINKIYCGDATSVLEKIDTECVDMVITSPPYSNLRNYGGTLVEWNHDKFKEIANELNRVLKPGGVIVWVVGDKTDKGSETCIPFEQVLYFREIGLNLNDTMIWCLSGGEYVYCKTKKAIGPMMLKDITRLNPSDVELWDGNKWVKVISFKENKNTEEKVRITLRSGQNIYCTKEHMWVLENGEEKMTGELNVGDKLKTCLLPNIELHNPKILDNDVLWLIGLYIAEGSHSEDTIQISLCKDEIEWVERIKRAIEGLGGSVTHDIIGGTLNVRIYSKVFEAILQQYISGKTSKDKHLNQICWKLPNEKLSVILDGYLDGDGSYAEDSKQWKLGFTNNYYLEKDLRCLCARLGYYLTLKNKIHKCNNKKHKGYGGYLKKELNGHYNEKCRSEIIEITTIKKRKNEHLWDVEVDSKEHLFALSSGVLTHNCKTNPMPQVKQPRYQDKFEYMFVFSKGKPKTFNPIMRKCTESGKHYKSTVRVINTDNDRKDIDYFVSDETVDYNVWDLSVAQNKILYEIDGKKMKHPAVFPYEIPFRHIKTWTNEGDLVLDPFIGSGTTALAAMDLKRNYIGIDANEDYCKIAEIRIKANEKV